MIRPRRASSTISIFGDASPERVRKSVLLQEADIGPLNTRFSRTFSAGDVVEMNKRHARYRTFNASGPQEDLLTIDPAKRLSVKLSPTNAHDPASRQSIRHYTDRDPSLSPKASTRKSVTAVQSQLLVKPQRTRALDCAPLGESLRIENHMQPDKVRQISLCGEVFKGFYNYDWTDVRHIQALRSRYPLGKDTLERVRGPFPQGMNREELIRNRLFDRSHGSERFPGGMFRVGPQTLIP